MATMYVAEDRNIDGR